MTLGPAIEIQRLKLLRLVAGLMVIVALASVGPVSRAFPVWVRRWVVDVLSRMESAAHSLVIAQAACFAAAAPGTINRHRLFHPMPDMGVSTQEALPSLVVLRRRLVKLRRILNDLSRPARRLLQRASTEPQEKDSGNPEAMPLHLALFGAPGRAVDRIERPPD